MILDQNSIIQLEVIKEKALKPKIAIIADSLDNQSAGVYVFTKELIAALIKLGYGEQLLLIRRKVDPNLPVEQIAKPNIRLPFGLASLRLFFIIPLILRREKVDIVFEPAHFGPFNLPKRIKRITMIHDLTPLLFPQFHRWYSQILQRTFLPTILKRTDWILTNSKHTLNDVRRFFPFCKNKSSHLYLGINESFVASHDPKRIAALGISGAYFLFVGTLEPRKNLVLLLDAFESFSAENLDSDVSLVLVGSMGWKVEELKRKLKIHPNKDRIKQLGFVTSSDLPILYTHASALIYPSLYEGFGLPIIEAMACGTNVVTARNSSLVEVGEGTAFFFKTHDAQDLKSKMELVLEEPKATELLIAHAKKFSWAKCAAQFISVCEGITHRDFGITTL